MTDKLGDRMKEFYENRYRINLPRRMPMIIRIDGKAFHTFTRGMRKPYDNLIKDCMTSTAIELCKQVQGTKLAYIQSDEISLIVTDYDDIKTNAWFDKNLNKIVSVSSSIATLAFNKTYIENLNIRTDYTKENKESYFKKAFTALFDSRAFILPKEEVVNYFIWRQNDATRNAIQSLGQSNFSHKQVMNLNSSQLQEKLFNEKNINFNNEPTFYKRGWCIVKEEIKHQNTMNDKEFFIRSEWVPEMEIPIFSQNKEFIEGLI